MLNKATKITAVTGAVVLSFGLAGPAFANGSGSTDPGSNGSTACTHAHAHLALTVDELRAIVTKHIDARLAWIAKAEARVTASTKQTDVQKSDALARLTKTTDALTALKAKVAAATTKSEIRDAVQAKTFHAKKEWAKAASLPSDRADVRTVTFSLRNHDGTRGHHKHHGNHHHRHGDRNNQFGGSRG